MSVIPVIIIVVLSVSALGAVSFGFKSGKRKKGTATEDQPAKDRNLVLREANKRLEANPKDPHALATLANLYFSEGAFSKAMRTYQLLLNQGPVTEIDGSLMYLRFGLSAMKCKEYNEAYRGLMMSRSSNPDGFEVNAGLGHLEFLRKNYEKAITFLQRALELHPDNESSLKDMGQCLYKLKRFSEAVPYLRKVADTSPGDNETLYALACCLYEIQQLEIAQKIFTHLRSDPERGASAALYSGSINSRKNQWEQAIADFQTGLNHEKIPSEIHLELKYRLAEALNQIRRIDKALNLLNEIYSEVPGYKDVASQIKHYRELNSNKNLQIYMLSPANEFIALCKKITQVVFPGMDIKITDIKIPSHEYADLLVDIKTERWEDTALLRFLRTEGPVGELFIRELYAHSKELRAGRGFCFTVGTFTNEAMRFVEARLIDLKDKSALITILKSIDAEEVLRNS